MSIYKIHIKTKGANTFYTIYETVLASVSYKFELNKYEVSSDKKTIYFDTAEEAHNFVRERITAHLASFGCAPNFINE